MNKNSLTRNIFLLVFFISSNTFVSAEQNILPSNLFINLNTASSDTARLNAYFELGEFYKAEKPDSALIFYSRGYDLINSLSTVEENEKVNSMKADIIRNIGLCYRYLAQLDKAIEYYSTALQFSIDSKNQLACLKCYNNIGLVYIDLGNYALALSNFFNAQRIAETLNNKTYLSTCYLNIGIIYYYQNSFDKALLYYSKSLTINKLLNSESDIADCYINIGVVLMSKNKLDAAINYFKRAETIFKKLDDKSGILNCYSNLGEIFNNKNDFNTALNFYQKALNISNETGDKISQANIYNSLANLYLHNKQNLNSALAIEYGKKALALSHSIKAILYERNAANVLMKAYKTDNNNVTALQYAELYLKLNDSLYSKDKNTALAETEIKFRTERKQLEIDKLNQEKKLQKSENLRQKIILFCTIAGFMLLVIFTLIITNRLKITRKQKKTIMLQKQQIETILHDVNQSIDYATLIQDSVLPDIVSLNQYFDSHFVLYLPKDKVSGDFYWWAKIYDNLIITVADCTGHGVPGAMMSMLGSSLLREIVQKEEIINPDVILEKLRSEIVKALKQTHSPKARKDGMDMALISINLNTNLLKFAGANNPIYITNNNSESKLTEYKPDRMPIAIYERMESFTNHEIKLSKGDIIYLFSDGYTDQFGGPKSKKFMSRNFKALLTDISCKSMNEQRAILSSTLEEWKTGHLIQNKQIDDITVLGIKI